MGFGTLIALGLYILFAKIQVQCKRIQQPHSTRGKNARGGINVDFIKVGNRD